MAAIILRRFRYTIVFLSLIIGILYIVFYAYYGIQGVQWQHVSPIVITIIIFITYIYAIYYKNFVHKFVRAFTLLGISIFWIYIHAANIARRVELEIAYECSAYNVMCPVFLSTEFLSIFCVVLIILEIGITLKNGSLPEKPSSVLGETHLYVSPLQSVQPPIHQQQQHQQLAQPPTHQHQQFAQPYPTAYYPQQQQQQQQQAYPMMGQQPAGYTPKYETQENIYQNIQRQSQSFYQPQAQQQQYYQQQAHPYSAQGYSSPQPQVPGSMITAAPQPGGSPIVSYPSPGHSVAVSPVLPVGGYSASFDGHSPVQRPM